MENIDYTIKRLQDQQTKVAYGDTQVWLDTTYSYIEEYFKSYSTRTIAFRSLVTDFRKKKIDREAFKSKGMEYISECLLYLKEQKEVQSDARVYKIGEAPNRVKTVDLLVDSAVSHPIIEKDITQPIAKVISLPYGLSQELFWILFALSLIFSFLLGFWLG